MKLEVAIEPFVIGNPPRAEGDTVRSLTNNEHRDYT